MLLSLTERRVTGSMEKRNGFMLVSSSLVRKYCVINLYAAKFFDKNFVLHVSKNKKLHFEK